MIFSLLCSLGLLTFCQALPAQEPGAAVPEAPVAALKREAISLEPLVSCALARDFLKATASLPSIAPRPVYLDESTKTYRSEAAAASLSPEEKSRLKRVDLDASFYWNTKYGSPLAYARPLDVLGRAGLENVSALKILDFGYGTVGHLRLLAGLGADVTGVDVDPLLRALYSAPADQGPVKNLQGRDGHIRLIDGRFPADPATTTAVSGNYDLFISKNTLKKGYVHPERKVEPRRLLNLGVDDDAFVKTLHHALNPGGWVLIYNFCPRPVPPARPTRTGPTADAPSQKTSGKKPASA